MKLQERKALLVRLGTYMLSSDERWEGIKHRGFSENNWFIPEFVEMASRNIASGFLQAASLDALGDSYEIPEENTAPKKVGVVMAGNIPLVGFHDLLCVFLTGHIAMVKPSSKDDVLIKHLVNVLGEWDERVKELIILSEMLKNCDAYIATGSNNSSRYFEYYFRNHPTIIRRNRTSIAILTGEEKEADLEALAGDVYAYFGLGCRNVTKIYVPKGYDFVPLLEAFRKYDHLANHFKYKNNYDYNLAMHILNNEYYMTNGSILLIERPSFFSRIGELHYEYYENEEEVRTKVEGNEEVQVIVSLKDVPFGSAQCPGVRDYADGVDTIAFLLGLHAWAPPEKYEDLSK